MQNIRVLDTSLWVLREYMKTESLEYNTCMKKWTLMGSKYSQASSWVDCIVQNNRELSK